MKRHFIAFVLLTPLLSGCAMRSVKKLSKPKIALALTNCQQVDVEDFPTKRKHLEVQCQCNYIVQKRDAKTGKILVECL